MAEVFISYSRRDKEFVQTLHQALSQSQYETWVDWEDIAPTTEWWREIEAGIEAAHTFIFVLSPDSVASKYCRAEADHALVHHKRIIPIMRRPLPIGQRMEAISHLQWLKFRQEDDFDVAFEALVEAINTDIDHKKVHTRLQLRALEWQQKQRDHSLLLRGSELEGIEQWLIQASTGKEPKPTPLQSEYVSASVTSRKASNNRQRATIGILATLLLLTTGAGTLAFLAQRNEAVARQFAQEQQRQAELGQKTAEQERTRAEIARQEAEEQRQFAQAKQQEAEAALLTAEQAQRAEAEQRQRAEAGEVAAQRQAAIAQEQTAIAQHQTAVATTARRRSERESLNANLLARSLTTDNLLLSNFNLEALLNGLATALAVQQSSQVRPAIQMQVAASLRQVVSSIQEKNRLLGHGVDVADMQFSPDGQIIASGGDDLAVRLWRRDGIPLAVLEGHDSVVLAVRFSPDGQILASSDQGNGVIRLWKRDGTFVGALEGHRGPVWDLQFTLDGQMLVSAGSDGTVRLWRRDGALLLTLEGHTGTVRDIHISPNGQLLASASDDGTVRLWRRDGTRLHTFSEESGAEATEVAFSPDGLTLAAAYRDGTLQLWHSDGMAIATLEGHSDLVTAVRFSPDGEVLASSSWDGTVRLWKADGAPLATLQGHADWVNDVHFTPDGAGLVSASRDGTVRLWLRDGTPLTTFRGHTAGVNRALISPDGRTLASASNDGTVRLWQANPFPPEVLKSDDRVPDAINGMAISPDGQTVAWIDDTNTLLWRRSDSALITLPSNQKNIVNEYISYSPDGELIAVAGRRLIPDLSAWVGIVRLWRSDGTPIAILQADDQEPGSSLILRFSPDGELLASMTHNQVILWSRTGTLLAVFSGHTDDITALAFSPDGQLIATASWDGTVRLWRRDGTPVAVLEDHSRTVTDISFSSDGQILASASWDGTVKLWRRQGPLLKTLTGDGDNGYITVNFSPDGNVLAASDESGTVYLWTPDGRPLSVLDGHADRVRTVRFSPDGSILASGDDAGVVRLWQQDGTPITTLEGHARDVVDIRFFPDGQTLASASWDGTVRLWDFTLDHLIANGCSWLDDYLSNPTTPSDEQQMCLPQNPDQMALQSSSGNLSDRWLARLRRWWHSLLGHQTAQS